MKSLLNLLLRWDPFVNKERVIPSIEPEQDVAEAETAQPSSCITKSKDKTDPRFVCETHGVPAVRRRCSHGVQEASAITNPFLHWMQRFCVGVRVL